MAALLALVAADLTAQSGVEKKRRQDIAQRVQRAMEKGSREVRLERVKELVDEGAPWCVTVIARGVATSYKRSKRMEKKIEALNERNADLYKRLKIHPVQKKGDRTPNDEINGNLDAIDALHERLAEERKFRGEALTQARKLARDLDAEAQEELARTLMTDLKASKGEQRLALIDVVGRTGLPVATAQALRVIQANPDQILRLAAIDALGESDDEAAAEGLVPFLKDPRWQIRVAVVESLRKLRRKVAIPALIEAMAREEGRVREDILEALQDITGVDKADNPAVWRNWWNENKDKPLALRAPSRNKKGAHRPARGGGGGAGGWRNRQAGAGGTSFYGIQTKSKHIVYVLDHSGSMKGPASSGESTGNDGTGGLTKIEVAKNELWKSIEQLAPDATFNILFFQTDYTVFKQKMVKANAANKRAAKRYIDDIVADGYTNIHDTLERAFQFGGQGAVDKAYKVNFDTIFFLTDGSPTAGKTTDTEEILAAVGRWNMSKRIKVHCVGIGAHNSTFLRKLSADTGGEYTSRGQQPQPGGRKRKS